MSWWNFFRNIQITDQERSIASRILMGLIFRLEVLSKIGLSYLHLDRLASTLAERVPKGYIWLVHSGSNLRTLLCTFWMNQVWSLHPKDTSLLMRSHSGLKKYRKHSHSDRAWREVIRKADYILDIGPHAESWWEIYFSRVIRFFWKLNQT